MAQLTNIEWCHHTHNEWIGCTKVHTGCTNCYAEALTKRYGWTEWGDNGIRKVTSEANRRKPLAWARAAAKAGERRRVFCSSLADVLDERAPADAQAHLWDTIRQTAAVNSHGQGPLVRRPRHPSELRSPGLDWLLLTKRPERWELIPEDVRPLVWLGTSVSDQRTADEWVPRLLSSRGFAKRFLSIEPLVGPVDLRYALPQECAEPIDWVIVGGESGPKARPCKLAWIESIVQQCAAAGVPCFVKQLGATPISDLCADDGVPFAWPTADRKGGDPATWPAALRVREFPRG